MGAAKGADPASVEVVVFAHDEADVVDVNLANRIARLVLSVGDAMKMRRGNKKALPRLRSPPNSGESTPFRTSTRFVVRFR